MAILKKILVGWLLLAFFINIVSAFPQVDIDVKPVFYEGDTIEFSYIIISQENEIIKYVANVKCEGSPEAPLEIREVSLERNEPFYENYIYGLVDENIKKGDCLALVSILEPYQLDFSRPFSVQTLEEFNVVLKVCNSSSCQEQSKIFVQGEDIYLNYSSDVENLEINATLTLPDKTIKEITIPTSIKAEQTGTYILEVTASKEGYKTQTLSTHFGVIEEEADIKEESSCFVNNKCEPELGENYKTCPQDCAAPEEGKLLIYVALAFIVLVVIFYIWLRKKEERKVNEIVKRIRR